MNKIIKISSIWPIFLIAFISWYSYILWLEQVPEKSELSNSIEAKDVRVSSKVNGRIKNVFIQEGSEVKKGQKLLELEGEEILAQLNQAKHSLKKSEYELIDLIKGSRKQEITQAVAITKKSSSTLEQAKINYKNIYNDFNRIQKLYLEGAVSQQTFDSYKAKLDIALKDIVNSEQELIKSKENESLVLEGPRKEKIKSLQEEVNYLKEKVKEYEKYSSELTVISPLDGEVSNFDLKVGEVVRANDPLLTITDLNDLFVRVYISNTELSKIKINKKIKLIADSYPNEFFNGYISYIGAKAEFTPRNIQTKEERSKLVYPVKIIITNKENKLKDGMYVTVTL